MENKENNNVFNEILNAYSVRDKISSDNFNLNGRNKNILDFGCGFGWPTSTLATSLPDMTVTGYDIDQERIDSAKKVFHLNFTSSMEEIIKKGPYDNIISSFVIEDSGPEILGDIHDLLPSEGILILFFYDIKGKDINQFSFNTGAEKHIFDKFGRENALKRWSQKNTKDYIKDVQSVGLTVLKTDEVPQSNHKYGYLVAQKKS